MDSELLYRFFEGQATFEEEVGVRLWMEASAANRQAFFKERRLFDAMLLSGKKVATEEVQKEEKTLEAKKRQFAKELLKAAAVVAITLGVNVGYQRLKQAIEPIAMQTLTVPAGQRINLTLPDGTNVWLNARTTLQYPVTFNADSRQVKLDGEAYFDVSKQAGKPFIVETGQYNIKVLGTKFNVDAYSSRQNFETTLMEGRVEISPEDQPADKLVLTPDNKAYLKEGRLQVEPVDDYNPYRWKEGLICFRNESLQQIMNDFETYYGIRIQINNQQILKYFFTGKFRQNDGIDYALRVLQKDIHFTYRRDDENQLIYIE